MVSYGGGVSGFNAYYQDTSAMTRRRVQGLRRVRQGDLLARSRSTPTGTDGFPSTTTSADEPIGDDLVRSAENAEAYRKAFPKGPPYFTAASSFTGSNRQNPALPPLQGPARRLPGTTTTRLPCNLLHQVGGDWAFYNGGNRWTYGTYMYKAAKQYGMKFRLSWHWNVVAGDPYYALDCREDDYAWCNSSPDGRLIPSVEFERLREGLDDYRRLLTLARLATEHPGAPRRQGRTRIDRDAHGRVPARPARSRLRCFPPTTGRPSGARWMMLIEALRK